MVYILLGSGFEEMEALTPCDLLRRAGIEVALAGVGGWEVTGGHAITVQADVLAEEMDFAAMEMLVIPGGGLGVQTLAGSPAAMGAIRRAYDAGKYVAAICAGPTLLARLGITDGKRVTGYPGTQDQMGTAISTGAATEGDGLVLTGRAAGSAAAFGLQLIAVLRGEQAAQKVAEAIVLR